MQVYVLHARSIAEHCRTESVVKKNNKAISNITVEDRLALSLFSLVLL